MSEIQSGFKPDIVVSDATSVADAPVIESRPLKDLHRADIARTERAMADLGKSGKVVGALGPGGLGGFEGNVFLIQADNQPAGGESGYEAAKVLNEAASAAAQFDSATFNLMTFSRREKSDRT